jgi:hypothetical protein
MGDSVKIKGFFHVQLVDKDNKVIGDSGLVKNTITNVGFDECFVACPHGEANSFQISYAELGTGTGAIASTANAVVGTLGDASDVRFTLSPSIVASKTARLTGQYDATNGTGNIAQVVLMSHATATGANAGIVCGGTFASSAMTSASQSLNLTYDIVYS